MEQKVVLVTGGSKGIGAAICLLAAQRGHAVAINYRDDETGAHEVLRLVDAAGGTGCVIKADVSDAGQVEQMMAQVLARFGRLDALVNNAGITGPIGHFVQSDPAMIEQVFRTNVFGLMHCCRAAVKLFQSAASTTARVIVNVSSTAATTGSPHDYVHYAASKAAVDAFTMGLAKEVAGDGIRVCGVAPGSTLTGIHARAGAPDRPARLAPLIPMGRLAAPEEIAEAVLWMMSDAASYVSGTTMRCSGGM